MLNIFPYMFYTIYWPIPVEVLVRLKYPMIHISLGFDLILGFEFGIKQH